MLLFLLTLFFFLCREYDHILVIERNYLLENGNVDHGEAWCIGPKSDLFGLKTQGAKKVKHAEEACQISTTLISTVKLTIVDETRSPSLAKK